MKLPFKNSCLESGPRASFFTRQLTRPWRLVPARATHTNYELILYYLHTQQQLCVLHNKHLLFCTRLHVRRSMLWLARARIYRVPGTKNDNKETARKKDITFFLFLFFLFKRYRSFQQDTLFVARSNVEQKRRYLQRVTRARSKFSRPIDQLRCKFESLRAVLGSRDRSSCPRYRDYRIFELP